MAIPLADSTYQGLIADTDILSRSSVFGTLAVTRSTNFPGTSGFSVAFAATANAAKSYSSVLSQRFNTNGVVHFRCKAGISGSPSAAIALLYGSASGTTPSSGGRQYVRCETDRTITIRDKNGNKLWQSVELIPTSGSARIVDVFFDSLTLATVWVVVLIDNVVVAAFDSGLTRDNFFTTSDNCYFGEPQPAGSNAGVTFYGADISMSFTTTASEAPHLTQWAKHAVVGAVIGDTDGTYAEWPGGTDTGGDGVGVNYWKEVDEVPHDGDTTGWQSGNNDQRMTITSTVANPIPASWTVEYIFFVSVLKLLGGGKSLCLPLIRLAGTNLTKSYVTVTTTNQGCASSVFLTTPAGGAWAHSDFDASTLEWGVQNPAAPLTAGARVTLMPGPVIVCYDATDLIQLTPAPADSFVPQKRRSMRAQLVR